MINYGKNHQNYNSTCEKHYHVESNHYAEWVNSAIDSSLIEANLESIDGIRAVDWYCSWLPCTKEYRLNTGGLNGKWKRKINHLYEGGWRVRTLDPRTGLIDDNDWGILKPNNPAKGYKNGKLEVRKYDNPPNTSTKMIWLKVPVAVWQRVGDRFGVEIDWGKYGANDFWQWVADNPIPLTWTEGAKKAAALLSQGVPAVAATGIFNNNPRPWEKGLLDANPELSMFFQVGREWAIAFDQDRKAKSRKNTTTAISRLATNIQKTSTDSNKARKKADKKTKAINHPVSILVWQPGQGKGVDDYIFNGHNFEVIWDKRLSYPQWLLKDIDALSRASIRVNERYFPEDIDIPADARLVALKGRKGTGKTQWLANQVEPYLRDGIPVYILTHRIQLAKALGDRLGIPYREEIKDVGEGGLFGMSLCVDSIQVIDADDLVGDEYVIVIDEVDQVLSHSVTSGTEIKTNRPAKLLNLEKLLINSTRTYIASADLSDLEIGKLEALMGCNAFAIVNDYIPHKDNRKATFVKSKQDLLVMAMDAASKGEKIIIFTDSQKAYGKFSSQTLEVVFNELGKKVLRIDSQSCKTKGHGAVGISTDLSKIYEYDVVLATPVLSTGISIEDKNSYFDAVFYFGNGAQSANDVCQMVERLRTNVPRFLFVPDIRIGDFRSKKQRFSDREKHNQFLLGQLAQADLGSLLEVDDKSCNFWVQLFDDYCEKERLSNTWYSLYIQEKMLNEGYSINHLEFQDGLSFSTKEDREYLIETRDDNWREKREQIIKADDIDDKVQQSLKDKRLLSEDEQNQLRKKDLRDRYGDIDKVLWDELIAADDKNCYQKLRLYFWLSMGMDRAFERDQKASKNYVEENNGVIYKPDFCSRAYGHKVAALNQLGISELLIKLLDTEISNESLNDWRIHLSSIDPQLLRQIGGYLGLSLNPGNENETNIRVLGKILKKIGLSLDCIGQRGSRAARARIYKITIPPYLPPILKNWRDRLESVEFECGAREMY